MPAVLRLMIHQIQTISQSLFVIPALVRRNPQVHPKFSLALRRAPKLITITLIVPLYWWSEIPVTPVPVVRDPGYFEGLPEYPPSVWYSPELDASKFTLHILSDTPGGFWWLKYIVLMWLPRDQPPPSSAFRSTASRSTASTSATPKFSSNLARYWTSSTSPNSLDPSLGVHL